MIKVVEVTTKVGVQTTPFSLKQLFADQAKPRGGGILSATRRLEAATCLSGREGGRDGGMEGWREGGRDGGREGRREGGMTVIHILIGMFNSNPMTKCLK